MLSFMLSLITNLIMLTGFISVVYWLQERLDLQRDTNKTKTQTLEIGAITFFVLLLFGESWVNTYLGPNAFGLHWTFLNMIIVTMFLSVVKMPNVIIAFIQAIILFVYLFIYATTFAYILVPLSFIFVAELFTLHRKSHVIFARRWLTYPALALLAATVILLIYYTGTYKLDSLFWLRQLGALTSLSIAGVEYTRIMDGVRKKDLVTAEKASHDSLTNLKNMSTFENDLEHAYQQYVTSSTKYYLFEIDIDYFKNINDTYGHLAGNAILVSVAKSLTDLSNHLAADAYRLGGEEFGILVFCKTDDAVVSHQISEQILNNIRSLNVGPIDQNIHLTVSLGEGVPQRKHYSFQDVYEEADRNLYKAKRSGRNRAILSDALLS